MRQQATAQPISGIGVQFRHLTKPRVDSHAIMPALVCFVTIAYEILSNQTGPPLWP